MNFIPIIISTLIALGVAYIAFQQFLLAREKFKLDMFEKRFAIYKAVQIYLDEIRKSEDASDKLLNDFLDKTHMAKFLFEDDIADFVEKLYRKGIKLNLANRPNEGLSPHQLAKHTELKAEAIKYFMGQNENFGIRFLPYLKFRKWSNGIWIDFNHKILKDYSTSD